MTVSHRKSKPVAKAEDSKVAEPGTRYHCDVCAADITLTVRIRCAEGCEDFDLCGTCFCNGAELGKHKASHAYRVVQQASYPIFCDEWGADEELLLLDGCQIYGLGNWADIADHIGNRSKEEVEQHYLTTYVEGKDGTPAGDERAKKEEARLLEEQRNSSTSSSIPGSMDSRSLYARADVPLDPVTGKAKVSLPPNLNKPGSKPPACGGQLPVVGPNVDFQPSIDADEFQKRKRRRIDAVRDASVASAAKAKAAASAIASGGTPLASTSTPKPLVSAPTSHSELAGYMPGRLEFEFEYEQEAENLVKDMEFGKIYKWGGEDIPGDEILLEEKRKGKQKEVEPGQEGGDVSMEDGERKPTDGNETSRPPITASSRSAAPPPGAASEGSVAAAASSSSKDPSASSSSSNTATATAPEPPPPVQHPNPAAPLADPDDKAPDWDEDPADLQLKLEVLDMYNERLDRRARKKEFVLERRLVEMKKNQALEKRKPKDERDLLTRVKHFAQMQNALNFDEFFNGLVHEEALRRAAAQLQACRKAGLTSLSEVAVYEAEKVDRAKRAAALAEGGFAAAGYALGFPGAQASSSGPRAAASSGNAARARARETSGTPQAEDSQALSAAPVSTAHKRRASNVEGPKTPRKPPRPLDISQHDSLRHLTPKEQICCSEQRILPNSFLVMKKEIIVEYLRRNGDLTRRDARTLFKMDVNKVGKVYDLLADEGYLAAASRGWNPADGIGVPPGHSEENSLGKTDSLRALLQGANGAISPMTASIAKSLDLKVRTPAEASQQQLQQKANSKNKEESLGISSIHRERTSSISSPLTQTPLNADPPSPGQPLPHQAPPQQQQQHHLSQSHLPNGTTPPHPQINVNPQ